MLLKTSRWVTHCLPFLLKPSLTSPHNDVGGVACPVYFYRVSWFYLPLYEIMWLYSCWQSRCPTQVSSSPPQRLLKTPNQPLVPSLPCSSLLTQHPQWSSYSTHLNLSYSCSKPLRDSLPHLPRSPKSYTVITKTQPFCWYLYLSSYGPWLTANDMHVCLSLYPVNSVFLGTSTVPGPEQEILSGFSPMVCFHGKPNILWLQYA